MGYGKILYIHEDGIRDIIDQGEISEEAAKAVGKAVLDVISMGEHPIYPKRHASVYNHGNCVNYVEEIHSTDKRAYLWYRNCLRPISKISDDELAILKEMVESEEKKRLK